MQIQHLHFPEDLILLVTVYPHPSINVHDMSDQMNTCLKSLLKSHSTDVSYYLEQTQILQKCMNSMKRIVSLKHVLTKMISETVQKDPSSGDWHQRKGTKGEGNMFNLANQSSKKYKKLNDKKE